MRWVRDNRRIGAGAALFAFALQLVLSFGHVHLGKLTFSSTAVSAQVAGRDGSVPQPKHTGADDFCAICATIALVASSVVPTSAALPLPVVTETSASRPEFRSLLASFDARFLFQARAPPSII